MQELGFLRIQPIKILQSYFKEPVALKVSVREGKSGYFCQDARICSTPNPGDSSEHGQSCQ